MDVSTTSLTARLRELKFFIVFSRLFAAVGVGLLLFSVLPSIANGYRLQSWQPAPAHLESAALRSNHGDQSSSASASYHYDYSGQRYHSSQMSIGNSMQVGDVQQRLGRWLESSLAKSQPVPVWVNPKDPTQAVRYRGFHWNGLVFSIAFVAMFGGIGLGILWFTLNRSSQTRKNSERIDYYDPRADKPWFRHRPWASPTVLSDAQNAAVFIAVFAVLWNLFSFPIAALALTGIREQPWTIIILIFPAVGIGLICLSHRLMKRWRRFGPTPLQMDPYPGAIGGQVGGVIDIPVAYDPELQFQVRLSCVQAQYRGSGKKRRLEERVVWQSDGYAIIRDQEGKTRLEILFNVDPGLPESDYPNSNRYYGWRLQVVGKLPGPDFNRTYEIPVFATGAKAANLRQLSSEHSAAVEARNETIESVLDLQQIPGGIEIFYPTFRQPAGKLAGVFVGCALIAGGLTAAFLDAGIGPVLGFVIPGASAVAVAAYALMVSMKVRLDAQGLTTEKRLLGMRINGQKAERQHLRHLRLQKTYSSTVGRAHTDYFKLEAVTHDGNAIKIGHNLPGREVAMQALEAVGLLTGIPVQTGEDSDGAFV